MRWMLFLAFALVAALPAAAAESQGVGIMFVNDGGLFGVRPDDSTSLSLVRANSCPGTSSLQCPLVGELGWSPDGTRLAFTFGTQLHLYDSRDGSQRLLPIGVDVNGKSRPAWSPDGRELAFSTVIVEEGVAEARPSGAYSPGTTSSVSDLYAINVEAGTVRKLTTGRQTTDPAWAPGSQIVYSGLVQGRWELFTIEQDGSHRQLTDGGAGTNNRPSWSPDGKEIAFLRDAAGLQPRLNVIRPDGSGLRQLSNLPIVPRRDHPAWSPDGSMIAVSTSLNGRLDPITGNKPGRDLYVVAADGSGERRLTESAERGIADRDPTWSPEGDQLAFESYDRDKFSESALYTVNADGRCERRVAALGGWRPDWQPLPGSALAPRECSDLAVVARGLTNRGTAGRVRVRLLNDGTKPLSKIGLRSTSAGATVVSARSPEGGVCSVAGGRVSCRIARLGAGAVVDVELVVEARVLRRVAGHIFGPEISFFVSTGSAEIGDSNNRQTVDVSTRSCTTGTRGAGSIRGTEGDDVICGRSGRDRIAGFEGADRIAAGPGNDLLTGGPGNDVIMTGPGTDAVSCGAGRDRVTVEGADRVARDCERVSRR